MAIALVKSNQGTAAATTAVTPAFASATTSGNLIVLSFSADNVISGVGSGWTQSTGMSQVGNNASHIWWRISTGQTTFPNITYGSNANVAWVIAEFSGVDAVPYDVSAGQHNETGANTYTTPTCTPTTGERLLVAAILGSTGTFDLSGAYTSWLNSFTAITGVGTNSVAVSDDVCAGFAYRLVTGNGSTTFSSGATYPGVTSCTGRGGLIIAFKEAAAGNVTLTAAAGNYALTGTSAGLAGKAILDPGSYALSGTVAAFAYKQPANAGSYTLTGTAAGLTVSGNVTLGAAAGSYTITGVSAGLAGKALLDPGAYSLTGSAATFTTMFFAGAGVYALTGSAASFEVVGGGFTLFCDPGAYTLSGTAATFPGYDVLPPVQPSPGGSGYAGAWSGPKRRKRKRDEIEELIDAVIQAPPQIPPQTPQIPQPPPPALIDMTAKMQAVGLTPPQRRTVKRAIVSDDEDDDEEAIELLLNLLS